MPGARTVTDAAAWARARSEWEAGTVSVRAIARALRVADTTVTRRAERHGWAPDAAARSALRDVPKPKKTTTTDRAAPAQHVPTARAHPQKGDTASPTGGQPPNERAVVARSDSPMARDTGPLRPPVAMPDLASEEGQRRLDAIFDAMPDELPTRETPPWHRPW